MATDQTSILSEFLVQKRESENEALTLVAVRQEYTKGGLKTRRTGREAV